MDEMSGVIGVEGAPEPLQCGDHIQVGNNKYSVVRVGLKGDISFYGIEPWVYEGDAGDETN